MFLSYPIWVLDPLSQNGTIMCGLCANVMRLEAKGSVGELLFGITHSHHKDCPLASRNGSFTEFMSNGAPVVVNHWRPDPTPESLTPTENTMDSDPPTEDVDEDSEEV